MQYMRRVGSRTLRAEVHGVQGNEITVDVGGTIRILRATYEQLQAISYHLKNIESTVVRVTLARVLLPQTRRQSLDSWAVDSIKVVDV